MPATQTVSPTRHAATPWCATEAASITITDGRCSPRRAVHHRRVGFAEIGGADDGVGAALPKDLVRRLLQCVAMAADQDRPVPLGGERLGDLLADPRRGAGNQRMLLAPAWRVHRRSASAIRVRLHLPTRRRIDLPQSRRGRRRLCFAARTVLAHAGRSPAARCAHARRQGARLPPRLLSSDPGSAGAGRGPPPRDGKPPSQAGSFSATLRQRARVKFPHLRQHRQASNWARFLRCALSPSWLKVWSRR